MAILVPDKIYHKIKKCNKKQKWTFYNNKGNNIAKRYNTYWNICTQPEAQKYIKQLPIKL